MVGMDARYVYAIIIGIVAGILLNVAYVTTAVIDMVTVFIMPVFPLGFGLLEAIVLFLFLAGVGAFTARLVRRRYGASGVRAAAVAGLVSGIIGQAASLLVGLLIAIAAAVVGGAAGYYVVGGDNPWLPAGALALGGLVLASLYTVVQYFVFSFIFMVLAGIGGFLYYHFTVTYPLKKPG